MSGLYLKELKSEDESIRILRMNFIQFVSLCMPARAGRITQGSAHQKVRASMHRKDAPFCWNIYTTDSVALMFGQS